MAVSNILAFRYGRSVFAAAEYAKLLDEVNKDFEAIKKFLSKKDRNLRLVISAQVPKRIKRHFWLNYVQDNKFCQITANLIGLLVKNNRLDVLAGIVNIFRESYNKHNGFVAVKLESAFQLDGDTKNRISDILSKKLVAKILLEDVTNAALLGGIVVTAGSKQLDFSLNSRLNKIKQSLTSKKYN